MVTIDLKGAYLHVPIFPHGSLLHFAIPMEQYAQHWWFSALPFGSWQPARESSQILAVVSCLHLQGISLIPYMDGVCGVFFFFFGLQPVSGTHAIQANLGMVNRPGEVLGPLTGQGLLGVPSGLCSTEAGATPE